MMVDSPVCPQCSGSIEGAGTVCPACGAELKSVSKQSLWRKDVTYRNTCKVMFWSLIPYLALIGLPFLYIWNVLPLPTGRFANMLDVYLDIFAYFLETSLIVFVVLIALAAGAVVCIASIIYSLTLWILACKRDHRFYWY